MQLLPLFLKLEGRRVLVVGDETILKPKCDALVGAGAVVCRRGGDEFSEADLDGVWLVIAAAAPAINAHVARLAEARQIFVNAVDDPPNASAYLGGVVRREGVTIAISTSGAAPALAGLLREGIDALLPADLDRWTAAAREARREWKASGVAMADRRPQLLQALNALYRGEPVVPAAAGEGRTGPAPGAAPSAQRTWDGFEAPSERSNR